FFFFFFQAEDGIRDLTVTGVQTCALPIWFARQILENLVDHVAMRWIRRSGLTDALVSAACDHFTVPLHVEQLELEAGGAEVGDRSEERRVGKECRCRWARQQWREQKEGRV